MNREIYPMAIFILGELEILIDQNDIKAFDFIEKCDSDAFLYRNSKIIN